MNCENPLNCKNTNIKPSTNVANKKEVALPERFFWISFFAIKKVILLSIMAIVLYKNEFGISIWDTQSGLDLLTTYALVSPANIIATLIIPNQSIIFLALAVFISILPWVKSINLKIYL